jgi:hypothetical protein
VGLFAVSIEVLVDQWVPFVATVGLFCRISGSLLWYQWASPVVSIEGSIDLFCRMAVSIEGSVGLLCPFRASVNESILFQVSLSPFGFQL